MDRRRHSPRGPAGAYLPHTFLSETHRAGPGDRARGRCRAERPYLAPRSRRSGRSRCRRLSAAPAAASCCGRGPSSPLGSQPCGPLSPGRRMRNCSAAPAPRGAPSPPAAPGGRCWAAPQAASRSLPGSRSGGPGSRQRPRAGPAREPPVPSPGAASGAGQRHEPFFLSSALGQASLKELLPCKLMTTGPASSRRAQPCTYGFASTPPRVCL